MGRVCVGRTVCHCQCVSSLHCAEHGRIIRQDRSVQLYTVREFDRMCLPEQRVVESFPNQATMNFPPSTIVSSAAIHIPQKRTQAVTQDQQRRRQLRGDFFFANRGINYDRRPSTRNKTQRFHSPAFLSAANKSIKRRPDPHNKC
jgi:hypothetical protein